MPIRPASEIDEPAFWEAVRLGEDSRLESLSPSARRAIVHVSTMAESL